MRGEIVSPRQLEMLRLISNGMGIKQLALALDISEQTIKNHRAAILFRLNATTMPHAVAIAFRKGLIV